MAQKYEVSKVKTPLKNNVFSPVIFDSLLIVCSDQKDRINHTVIDQEGNEPVDLYFVNPNQPGYFKRFDEKFRSSFHDGPISFNKHKNFLAISRNLNTQLELRQKLKEENLLGIYFSTHRGNNWSDIEPFDHNGEDYSCTHPTLDAKGTTMYFASNMPGGYGGYDIYKSTYQREQWGKPVNLGPAINTEKNEVFPSLVKNQVYFSSNRGEIGGLDMYLFSLIDSSATLLDTTFNSEFDEFGWTSDELGEKGYFSSNRDGQDGIYSFEFIYPEFNGCDSIVETYFCYTLEDEYALELESTSGLVYIWNVDDKKLPGVSVDYCFPETGDYEITLDIVDTVINQTFYEQSYIYLSIQHEQQPYINCPDTVQPGETFILNAENTYLPYYEIDRDDYYWLINGEHHLRGYEIAYQFDSVGVYEIQLGIIGSDQGQEVTDCSYKYVVCGTPVNLVDTTNKNLLDFVENPSDQLNVTRNDTEFADATDTSSFYTVGIIASEEILSEDDPRLKLLEGEYEYRLTYLKEKEIYLYHIGQYEDMGEAQQDWRNLKQLGYDDAMLKTLNYSDDMFELNEMFELENIHFESAKWDILPAAKLEIDKLVEILELLTDFNVEINAHTDNTASVAYNQQLSERRAKSIKNYLISNGISASRITSFGFGENKPIASNETEEGKALNRRVEFKLIKAKTAQ